MRPPVLPRGMLPPRMLQALGLMAIAAGALAYGFSPLGAPALVVGVGLGLGILAASFVGGGPQPVPKGGYPFDEAMVVLRRASVGGVLMAGAATAVAAALWWMGQAGPIHVVQVFLLSLLVAYASTITAAGVVVTTDQAGEE